MLLGMLNRGVIFSRDAIFSEARKVNEREKRTVAVDLRTRGHSFKVVVWKWELEMRRHFILCKNYLAVEFII